MIPLLVFAALWIHGSGFGLTDDEAYYWVLAQRPDWGYAFHPPAIAWSIAIAQKLAGWMFAPGSSAPVRLVSASYAAWMVALAVQWIRDAGAFGLGATAREETKALRRGALTFLAFAGMFALSWMVVPDLPLFTGWMLAFTSCFRLCFRDPKRRSDLAWLGLGVLLATLSKYSGVAVAASAGACLWLWAPRRVRNRGWAALAIGTLGAVIPVLAWNARHEWGSLAYQFSERHGGGGISWLRYARFWAIQLVIAGPLFVYAFRFVGRIRSGRDRVTSAYVAIWAAPAAIVYFIQPLWAEFKPHWALIAWLPFALELAFERARDPMSRFARAQMAYGWSWIALVFVACHDPVMARIGRVVSGKEIEPKLDVTNDMYGWSELPRLIAELESAGGVPAGSPVVGSRYQTASQAAFSLGSRDRVALIPRDAKQMDEWPRIEAVESQGPGWPKLLAPVLFVADNRYDAGPEFPEARCSIARKHEERRSGYVARKITLWICRPSS